MKTLIPFIALITIASAQDPERILSEKKEAPIVFKIEQIVDGGAIGKFYDPVQQKKNVAAWKRFQKTRAAEIAAAKGYAGRNMPYVQWTERSFFLAGADLEGLADGDQWKGWVVLEGIHTYYRDTLKKIKATRAAGEKG